MKKLFLAILLGCLFLSMTVFSEPPRYLWGCERLARQLHGIAIQIKYGPLNYQLSPLFTLKNRVKFFCDTIANKPIPHQQCLNSVHKLKTIITKAMNCVNHPSPTCKESIIQALLAETKALQQICQSLK